MKKFSLFALLLLLGVVGWADQFEIVTDGQPKAVVIQGRTSRSCTLAVETLVRCVEKSTGVKLQVIRPKQLDQVPANMNRIFVGDSSYSKAHGYDSEKLLLEEYQIGQQGKDLFLLGHDKEAPESRITGAPGTRHPTMDSRQYSPATAWAVTTLLEHNCDVRFLWPDDLGTYCPKTKTIAIHRKYAFKDRPYYARRQIWFGAGCNSRVFHENNKFMLLHQQGSRIQTWFTDGFQGWWEKYNQTLPEVIALSPEGKRTFRVKPIYVKLCISNPKVKEIVLQRWRAAGRPDTWSMCPNDGAGFCTCQNCRKWDGPEAAKATAEDIWNCRGVNLTRRYITFWNQVITAMRKENPNVYICVFGYGPYKVFPEDAHLEPGVLSAIVPSDFDVHGIGMAQWKSWANSGAKLFNRPNWLNTFYFSPYFPLKETAEFIRMAEPCCMGYEHDTFGGTWPTQGLYVYMIVRMSYRRDLTVEDIKKEYISAFGKGAPAIRKWIEYWEKYTDRLRGGVAEEADQKRGGLYDKICAGNKYIRPHILYGCWDALAEVYPKEVMAPAYALLDEADKAIGNSDPEAKARVDFLRQGMLHIDKMIEVMNLWWKPGATSPQFLKAYQELYDMRGTWEKNYVLCRHGMMYNEFARRIRIVPFRPDGKSRQIESDYVKIWMPKMIQENGGPVNKQ